MRRWPREREAAAGPLPAGIAKQGRGWLAAQLARADVDAAEEQARVSAELAAGGRRRIGRRTLSRVLR